MYGVEPFRQHVLLLIFLVKTREFMKSDSLLILIGVLRSDLRDRGCDRSPALHPPLVGGPLCVTQRR